MLKVYAAQLNNTDQGGLSELAWNLLETACGREGIGFDKNMIVFGPHGKPYFSDQRAYFSLSHSGKQVLCVLSDREVGCDVQVIRPCRDSVCRRILSDDEFRYVNAEEGETRNYAYTRLWTFKESAVKLTGEGLSRDLRSGRIGLKTNPVSVAVPGKETLYLYDIDMGSDSAASVCSSYRIATKLPCFTLSRMIE